MHLFSVAQGPGEEQVGHAGERFDIVKQKIVDRLVATNLLTPGTRRVPRYLPAA